MFDGSFTVSPKMTGMPLYLKEEDLFTGAHGKASPGLEDQWLVRAHLIAGRTAPIDFAMGESVALLQMEHGKFFRFTLRDVKRRISGFSAPVRSHLHRCVFGFCSCFIFHA